MRQVLIADAVAEFLADAAQTVSPITFALYERYLLRLVDAFPGRRLVTLTPAEVRTWGKVYHVVQAVQRLCSWAKRERRLVDVNPLEGMRKSTRGRRLRILSPAETCRLLRAAGPEFRALLFGLRESIARPGELRRATWGDVRRSGLQPCSDDDLVAGRAFVFLSAFKASDQRGDRQAYRVIPISARLGRLLVRLRGRATGAASHLFVNRRGRPWTVNAVMCRLRRLRTSATLPADHRGERVCAYSLRHTGATKAICAGVDVATLAAVMGHTDIRMTTRYLHLAPDHLAKSMKAVQEAKNRFRPKNERTGSLRTRPDGSR